MGRRKIEIKAIKDDRNRSVYVANLMLHARYNRDPHLLQLFISNDSCITQTASVPNSIYFEVHCERRLIDILSTFLKRKGGLFKKAHELSVLCSVEVAVIIFGHNKKLYEYSSHDINETIGKFQYVRDPLLRAKEQD